jgi:ABC-2 type transport system permease protein
VIWLWKQLRGGRGIGGPGIGGPGIATLARTELRMFIREPLAMFFGVLFPIVLLIIIGATTGNQHKAEYGGLRYIDVYTPVLFVFAFAIVGVQVMPATLVTYRQKGYLRRLSTTPVGAARLVQAQWMIYTGMCIVSALVIAVVARLAFSVHLPTEFLAFIIILLLTAAAMLALGTLISSVGRTPRESQIIGLLLFYPMMFLSGLFGEPLQTLGHVVRTIGHCTPLGASVTAIEQTMEGHWPPGWCFLCLIAWAVIVGRLAVRFFRWE